MYKQPAISVIVPVFNVREYIEKCARSLFEQTFESVEYVFVNDCSSDDSIQIIYALLKEYPSRAENVQIINHKQNSGVAVARNTGLACANGKYVIFCDSDDWMNREMLQKLYMAAEAAKADVAMCDFYMVGKKGLAHYHMPNLNVNKTLFMQHYLQYPWNVVWNLLIRKDLLHGLNFPVGYTYCEDFNFTVKLFYKAKAAINVCEPLYYYNRLNENSVMNRFNSRMMHDEQEMYLDVIAYFKQNEMYPYYAKQLCWRILKSKQEWLLDEATYTNFLSLYPECHNYIWSCPFLNVKIKIMAYCLTHHLKPVSVLMLKLRNMKTHLIGEDLRA